MEKQKEGKLGWGKVWEGRPVSRPAQEGGWYQHLGQILTPGAGLVHLTQGPRICASDFAGADQSSPVLEAGTQHGVRGIHSSYSKLHSNAP